MSDGPIMSDGLHNRRIYVFENQDGVRGLEWWIGTGKGGLGEEWGIHLIPLFLKMVSDSN